MHVPWGWIKQRPHFFAEYLAKDLIVDVYYKKAKLVSKKNQLTLQQENSTLSINGFRQIAFDKIPGIKHLKLNFLNDFLLYWQLPDFKQYDYVWFTCPSIYPLFKNRLSACNKVIYDCMDDVVEFPFCKNNLFLKKRMIIAERELMERADKIFCSSNYLKDKITSRVKLDKEVIELNNAIELPQVLLGTSLPNSVISSLTLLEKYPHSLLYVGTISEWFDFELLLDALNKYEKLHLMLVGPSDIAVPMHPKIHYLGTVERTYIFLLMKKAWCLTMPFKVNELIRSVNPVKLYEYIYMGKHIVAPEYGETLKFAQYVHLYKSKKDFFTIIDNIFTIKELDPNRVKSMRLFAENNTWSNRYKIIRKNLYI